MTVEHFSVKYDGPALTEHRIDVRALAPSLVALADMFTVANELLGEGLSAAPSLQVQAHREGSFSVDLLVQAGDAMVDLFNHRGAIAAATVLTLAQPCFDAIRWVKMRSRRGHERSVETMEPGTLRVTWPDGTAIETTTEAAELVESMDFRREARGVAEPLDGKAITSVTITPQSGAPVRLEKQDLLGFDLPDPEPQPVATNERRVVLELVTVGMRDYHKWRVSDGGTPFWVSLDDLAFQQRIDTNQESFSRYDALDCTLREVQYRTITGRLSVERSVVKVHRHIRAARADPLPFHSEEPTDESYPPDIES